MNKRIFNFTLALLSVCILYAQPSNDNCTNPVRLTNIKNYCSRVGEFNNLGATASGYGAATCWASATKDVWFVFNAQAPTITITVIGTNVGTGNRGGTLSSIQAALYLGTCGGTISELACVNDNSNIGIVSFNKGGLVTGQQYFLRINGRNGVEGTFQICIKNFFPPAMAEEDCRTATVLCDNTPFVNAKLGGTGVFNNEASGSCLGEGNVPSEQQSSWYTWIAKTDCKLTFTITPLKSGDDIDFALYELPSGIRNCNDKKLMRCSATHPVSNPPGLFCGYSTGLDLTSRDTTENLNCDVGEDGFCKYVDMKAGTAYTLIINNFTESGIGFSIDWGSCEFQGPEPEFKVVPDSGLRCETLFDVTDFSTFQAGNITSYDWNFGVGAVPATANTKGPHGVFYNSFGEKFITLTLTTNLGCKISKVLRIVAEPCCEDNPTLQVQIDSIIDVKCFGESNGRVVFRGLNGNPYTDQFTSEQYYTFSLDGVNFLPLTELDHLPAGKYRLYVQDRKGCINFVDFEIKEPPPVVVNAGTDLDIKLGDIVDLSAMALPNNSYIYNWSTGNGTICNNCQSIQYLPLKEGYYVVTATDPNGCIGRDSIYIRVKREYNIYIPNVISANDDHINDFLEVFANAALESLDLVQVYDRWGGRLYSREKISRSDFNQLWDGRVNNEYVNPGVFTYLIIGRFIDGTTKEFSGDLTVLR